MRNIKKYQYGDQAQMDYSSMGFLTPETMSGLFNTTETQAPQYSFGDTDSDATSENDYDRDDEVSMLKEQNSILQETLDRMKSQQQENGEDFDIDQFMKLTEFDDNIPIDPDELEASYYDYKDQQFQHAKNEVLQDKNIPPSYYQKFRTFATPEEGRNALLKQLRLYQTGKSRTGINPNSSIYEAMSIYAPSSDKNNPKQYAEYIASRLGISPFTPIANIDADKWADAITEMEGNKYGNNPGNLKRTRQFGGSMMGYCDMMKHPSKDMMLSDYLKKHGTIKKSQYGSEYIPVALLPEQQAVGLNNEAYSEMLFNTGGYNTFRGLDNYQPVYIKDQNGKEKVLYGPEDTSKFYGKVYEKKLSSYKRGGKIKY